MTRVTSNLTFRIAGLQEESVVDGPGYRLAVFTQGCPHRCPGCHNPATHDASAGTETSVEALIDRLRSSPLHSGLTLSGGDPFMQPVACAELARKARALGYSVWTYTGWTFEELLSRNQADEMALLHESDTLIDGRFVLARRTLELPFRGSSNQRIIDVAPSLASGRIIEKAW